MRHRSVPGVVTAAALYGRPGTVDRACYQRAEGAVDRHGGRATGDREQVGMGHGAMGVPSLKVAFAKALESTRFSKIDAVLKKIFY